MSYYPLPTASLIPNAVLSAMVRNRAKRVTTTEILDHLGNVIKSKKTGLYSWLQPSTLPHSLAHFLAEGGSGEVTTDLTMPKDDDKKFNYMTYHPDGKVDLYLTSDEDENPGYYRSSEDGETVFSDGGWHLAKQAKYDYDPPGFNEDKTYIWHYCEERQWRNYPDGDHLMIYGTCDECNEPVPDSVLTIWKIQNIDSLPCGDIWHPYIMKSANDRGHAPGDCDDPWCICGDNGSTPGFGPVVKYACEPKDPKDIEVVETMEEATTPQEEYPSW